MKFFLLLFPLVAALSADAQGVFDFTSSQNRQTHDRYLRDTVIAQALSQPLSRSTEHTWQSAFWAMELMLYKSVYAKEKLGQAWKTVHQTSEEFQKALLEATYTLYPTVFDKAVLQLLHTTASPAVFIRCAECLLRSKNKSLHQSHIQQTLQRFTGNDFTGFSILKERLEQKTGLKPPPLKALFDKNFLAGQTVVYSLQRRSRNYPGLVIVRKPDGSFVRNGDGTPFHAAQLARAITNYPFYITNGNTPQGIFRWTGFDTSSNKYIGPTPNLQLVMPYEANPSQFFSGSVSANIPWSIDLYASLLPLSWKKYKGIYESFRAGQIGRTEIIMHGTTINPTYYQAQPYFPQTPSLGCLCSYEAWDKQGRRVFSEQQKIVDVLYSLGSTGGYVVVVDLDNKKAKVVLREIGRYFL